MNYRDKQKLNRATELAADAIYEIVETYITILVNMVDNEMEKLDNMPSSLHTSPVGLEVQDSIKSLDNRIDDAEIILFSRVMNLSGKEDVFKTWN
jgi:hypothetical protein